MPCLRLFTISLLATAAVLLGIFFLQRSKTAPKLVRLADKVFVSSQLSPKAIPALRRDGIAMIVDFRPDGEDRDQASSSLIGSVSKENGLDFHYIPVLKEYIPDSAVNALSEALSRRSSPSLLYCRTGRRAVQTFALVEASRADGPGIAAIMKMVRDAGFHTDGIEESIARRVEERGALPPAKN